MCATGKSGLPLIPGGGGGGGGPMDWLGAERVLRLHVPEIAASERQVVSVPGGPHARETLDARDQIRGEPQC